MKKSFKSLLVCTMVLLTGIVAVSCSNITTPEEEKPKITQKVSNYVPTTFLTPEQAFKYVGDNPKTLWTDKNNESRYVSREASGQPHDQETNQNHWGMENNIILENTLVEYDSINPTITAYVETTQKEYNSGLEMNGDELAKIMSNKKESTKKMVEFVAYIDKDNNDTAVYYDIRIFDYDSWNNNFAGNKFGNFAKAIIFSPDFKIDLVNKKHIGVDTKDTYTAYKYPNAKYKNEQEEKDYTLIIEDKYIDGDIRTRMDSLGQNPSYGKKLWPKVELNTTDYFYISQVFQYDDFPEKLKNQFTTETTGELFGNQYIGFNEKKHGIELVAKVNRKTDKIISYEFRKPEGKKAKIITFTPEEFISFTNN